GDLAQGWSVTADPAGNVIVAGDFNHTVDFGTGPISSYSPGNFDVFVAKYSPQGMLLWSKTLGGAGTETATGVAADSQGNIVLAGRFQSSNADFGGATLSAGANAFAIAVAKLTPAGATLWARRWGGTNDTEPRGVAVDASGDVVITGQFMGSTDLVGGTISP